MEVFGVPTGAARDNAQNLNWAYAQGAQDWTKPAWRENSYQLISPGADQKYGRGGVFNPNDSQGVEPEDRDNITNFSSGATLAN